MTLIFQITTKKRQCMYTYSYSHQIHLLYLFDLWINWRFHSTKCQVNRSCKRVSSFKQDLYMLCTPWGKSQSSCSLWKEEVNLRFNGYIEKLELRRTLTTKTLGEKIVHSPAVHDRSPPSHRSYLIERLVEEGRRTGSLERLERRRSRSLERHDNTRVQRGERGSWGQLFVTQPCTACTIVPGTRTGLMSHL